MRTMLRRLGLLWLWFAVACGGDDGASWRLVASSEPASLLAVWGTTATDVWVVGGRSELTGAPTVLRLEGERWSRVDTGLRGVDLWWAFGFEGSDVFLTGSGGTIVRYRGGAFERMATPRSGIIFGLWGTGPNDLWAVGAGDNGSGIVWRYDGVAWRDAALPAGVPGLVFKVHGQASNDVWISCAGGVTLHWDGVAVSRVVTGVTSSLFSIVTTPDLVVAAGGATGEGRIAEHSAGAWTALPSIVPVPWRGVAAGAGEVYAVGESGVVGQRTATGWQVVPQSVTQLAFHAAWVDPDGGLWGTGGMFETLPLTRSGFLTYYGAAPPSEVSP